MDNLILNTENINIEKILSKITKSKSFCISGLTSLLRLILLNFIAKKKKVLFITATEQNALRYQNDLKKLFGKKSNIFPYQDVSMYEGVPLNLYKYAEQLEIINNLEFQDIVIAPVKALSERFAKKEFFKKNVLRLKLDDELDLRKLAETLTLLGYKRSTMVVDVGEFSIRGDIVDIYSMAKCPVRVELWGDTVTDIRYFDPTNQRSFEKVKQVEILPLYKFILDENVESIFKSLGQEIFEKYENEKYFEGIEYFQCLLNPDTVCFAGFLDSDWVVIFDESSEIYSRLAQLDENYTKNYLKMVGEGIVPTLKAPNHVKSEEFVQVVAKLHKISFDNFIDSENIDIIEFQSNLVPSLASDVFRIAEYIEEQKKLGYKVVIATDYKSRVEEILRDFEILYSDEFRSDNSVFFTPNIACGGSVVEELKLCVLTDKELFNKKSKDITTSKRSYNKEKQEFLESVNDIKEGEYVVHHIHGIGRYLGLSKQEIDGQLKDYLSIEYQNGDRLHIPAEQINMLARYRGSAAQAPRLSKMGGNDWNVIKSKVKKAVEDVAEELLRLYAKRQASKGIEFEPDTIWQYEMEEAFEYTETPDQMKAIEQTKSDMESDKPMDRLICGDVGFGKTEVALRAVFKAVMSGKQAAVVVPTTILALQHFQTLAERFKPFPIKVELLSRFRTAKEQKETVRKLALGEVDVVVGTHRLLQKDILFKDLGLLVVDEEHRFGVKHKEQLKMMRKNIDILSMSATPIPRTLYMSLSGIKDMSVINTPPKNRLPIKTYVGNFDENTVKNAILHELDRDGQVFFLYNRVETIYEFAAGLRNLIPNLRIAVAHGQMDEKELENIMVEFEEHKYDVLLCTTIIESGLDISNANTMLIYDAHKLGLAQLYQIRGRVGRSDRQAYCYCFYRDRNRLTQEALSRLEAIKSFTTLGSGYQIALRDIEIRGVGNILGTKQHGHMVNVGFDTYCQLLEEAVQEVRGEKVEEVCNSIIDINVTAFIPDEWVGSKEQKIIEYKRLSDVKSTSELDLILAQWKDRFSKLPKEVDNLSKLVRLRVLASEAKIPIVRETAENIRIYTPYQRAEWSMIRSKLSKENVKYIKYTDAPATCQDVCSILLLNTTYLNFEEIYSILTDLFYYISKLRYDYNT